MYRWGGEGEIRDLCDTLMADGDAAKAYLVTAGYFNQAVWVWVEGELVELIDGEQYGHLPRILDGRT